MATFSDQIENIMKGFMGDFSVLGKDYLENSDKVLKNRQETHFDLNWRSFNLLSEKRLSLDIGCPEALVSSPIIYPPDWKFPFETPSDANDYTIRTVPGQCKDNQYYAKSYASKTLTGSQLCNNGERTSGIGICLKFSSFLVGAKVIVYTDHATPKHLLIKKEVKP